jgi:flagellar protein FlgJ
MNFAIAAAGTMPAAVIPTVKASLSSSDAASSTAAALQHHKLVDAAQQFEGMLLQEMLKPMKEHGFCQDDDSEDKDGSGGFADSLTSFGTESVATAIAKGGGLGLAKRIVEQVEGEKATREVGIERTAANAKKITK